jgi:pyruvate/2-oxoglutarate dehydrogenase complex dihydrolipoamide dehydrogenase (E3) component
VASVGWAEHEATEAGLDVVIAFESGRFITEKESTVVDPEPTTVKLLAKSKSKRILGCLAIGPQVDEIVNPASSLLQLDGPNSPSFTRALVKPYNGVRAGSFSSSKSRHTGAEASA